MRARHLVGPAMMLGLALLAGQYPPLTPNTNGGLSRPEPEHKLPMDQPDQAQQQKRHPQVDAAQLKREADELAKLSGEIPPAVEQASKGVIAKDLNERLKRIEKLAKQLRRELYQ